MKLFTEHTIPPIVAALTLTMFLLVVTTSARAADYSVIVGLHIGHTGSSQYVDYTAPNELGEPELRTNATTGQSQWVQVRPSRARDLNEGFAKKNKLIGLRIQFDDYALSAVTYRNSFYRAERKDRSFGLGVTRIWAMGHDINVEAGAALLSGYRKGLVDNDDSESLKQELLVAPTLSAEYRITRTLSLTHTVQGFTAHVTALKINF